MPYLYLIDEAIGLLNNEIRLVEWRIKYPEQFKSHFNKQPFSPLYLADKTNLIDIMEIISGLCGFPKHSTVWVFLLSARQALLIRATTRSFISDFKTAVNN